MRTTKHVAAYQPCPAWTRPGRSHQLRSATPTMSAKYEVVITDLEVKSPRVGLAALCQLEREDRVGLLDNLRLCAVATSALSETCWCNVRPLSSSPNCVNSAVDAKPSAAAAGLSTQTTVKTRHKRSKHVHSSSGGSRLGSSRLGSGSSASAGTGFRGRSLEHVAELHRNGHVAPVASAKCVSPVQCTQRENPT